MNEDVSSDSDLDWEVSGVCGEAGMCAPINGRNAHDLHDSFNSDTERDLSSGMEKVPVWSKRYKTSPPLAFLSGSGLTSHVCACAIGKEFVSVSVKVSFHLDG